MPRYAAFLRGVTPTNLKMAALKSCLENAGFSKVETVLASGNVVFDTRSSKTAAIEQTIEKALEAEVGRPFYTLVRAFDTLESLLQSEPYAKKRLPTGAKRVVTFFRDTPKPKVKLPVTLDGACILTLGEREAFTYYERRPGDPVFMRLLDQTFGKDITTRTWETIEKVLKR